MTGPAEAWTPPNTHRYAVRRLWVGFVVERRWGFWPSPDDAWRLTRAQAERVGMRWLESEHSLSVPAGEGI